jgi:hypothetical protein
LRPHRFVFHKTAAEIVKAFFADEPDGPDLAGLPRTAPSLLKRVRQEGMWGYCDIPSKRTGEAVVHLWWRANKNPLEVCVLIGHELGHLVDSGRRRDPMAEEDRANDFAAVARETVLVLTNARR